MGPRRHAPTSGPTEDAPPPTRCGWGAARACVARSRGQHAAEAVAGVSKCFEHAPSSRLIARATELGAPHPAPLVDPQLPMGTARRRRRGLCARCLFALAGRRCGQCCRCRRAQGARPRGGRGAVPGAASGGHRGLRRRCQRRGHGEWPQDYRAPPPTRPRGSLCRFPAELWAALGRWQACACRYVTRHARRDCLGHRRPAVAPPAAPP